MSGGVPVVLVAALMMAQPLANTHAGGWATGALAQTANPSEDEISNESRTLEEFEDREDPVTWLTETETGLHYRRSTTEERAQNDWPAGTHLVETGSLDDVTRGNDFVEVIVPRSDTEVHKLVLERVNTTSQTITESVIQGDGSVVNKTEEIDIHRYRSNHSEQELEDFVDNGTGPVLDLGARDGGGYYAEGIHDGAMYQLFGNDASWFIEGIPTATGGSVGEDQIAAMHLLESPVTFPTSSHCPLNLDLVCQLTCSLIGEFCPPPPECDDGSDNDGDEWVDFPDDPGCDSSSDDRESDDPTEDVDFGLFGEVKWCEANEANWGSIMDDVASDIEDAFRNNNGGTLALMDNAQQHCWTFDDGDPSDDDQQAEDCDTNGCGDYVYGGCDSRAHCYKNNVWDDETQSGLKVAQVIHDGIMEDDNGNQDLCGVASFPSGGQHSNPKDGPDPSGDSVTVEGNSRCDPFVPTHENGHALDAIHPEDMSNPPSSCQGTVMDEDGSFRDNEFCDRNRKFINECISDRSNCPRGGTS